MIFIEQVVVIVNLLLSVVDQQVLLRIVQQPMVLWVLVVMFTQTVLVLVL
jgi:hypothetical protein